MKSTFRPQRHEIQSNPFTMGKNGRFGKDYGKVVGKDSKSRPGWKGPGYTKKAGETKVKPTTSEEKRTPELVAENSIPVELQQLLLNIFRDPFPTVLASDTLQPLLQEVKTALYDRDFARAFGRSEYLEAYAIRWSAGRTLCYQSILFDLRKQLADILPSTSEASPGGNGCDPSTSDSLQSSLRVICFGGCAAEVVAFGGFLRYLHGCSSLETEDVSERLMSLSISRKTPKIDLLLVDSANWQDVVQRLQTSLTTPPPLSKYASALAKEANSPLIAAEGGLGTTFHCEDVLGMNQSQIAELIEGNPILLTLLFTLNELYTSSIGKTTKFLLNLTTSVKPGSILLVVDSPGSYSEATLGVEAKKYPMKWLLDHTLLESEKSRGQENRPYWEKLLSEDSKWFRVPENLRYPISLENMRYQIHLYRRI